MPTGFPVLIVTLYLLLPNFFLDFQYYIFMFLFNFFIASPLEQFRILPAFSFFGIVG
jgi:hypothetical protein